MKKLHVSINTPGIKNLPGRILGFALTILIMLVFISFGNAQTGKSKVINPPSQGPVVPPTIPPTTGPTVPPIVNPIPASNLAVRDLSFIQEGNNTFISVIFKAASRSSNSARIRSKFNILLNGKQIARGGTVVNLNSRIDACKVLECNANESPACGCQCPDDLGKWIVDTFFDLLTKGAGIGKSLLLPSYNKCELVVVTNPTSGKDTKWCQCYFHFFVKFGPYPAGTFRPGDQLTIFLDSAKEIKEYDETDNMGTCVYTVPQVPQTH